MDLGTYTIIEFHRINSMLLHTYKKCAQVLSYVKENKKNLPSCLCLQKILGWFFRLIWANIFEDGLKKEIMQYVFLQKYLE